MRDYVLLIRPAQWVKNVFVFAGLAFGEKLLDPQAQAAAWLAFAAFCLASSSAYVINDILDREHDRLHPTKRNRPLARGVIGPGPAMGLAVALIVAAFGLTAAARLPAAFALILSVYFALNVLYSLALKHRVILDVIVISVGFVLRAWAGAAAVQVSVSPWLIVCTFTLCLFLGFGKRRCELAALGNTPNASGHRPTLARYTPELLNHLISVSAGIAVITFLLYTMETEEKFGTNYLIYTIPLVVYGIFRYAMLVQSGRGTGPSDILINDRPFLYTVVLWAVAAVVIIYWGPAIRLWLQARL